jgi:hypothetical protein
MYTTPKLAPRLARPEALETLDFGGVDLRDRVEGLVVGKAEGRMLKWHPSPISLVASKCAKLPIGPAVFAA